MTAMRNGLIDQLVQAHAELHIRFQREVKGDRYATAEEVSWLLTDPTAAFSHAEYEAAERVAAGAVQRSIPAETKRRVRAFLRIVYDVLEQDAIGQAAEDAAGWPNIATRPTPLFFFHRIRRAMLQLGLTHFDITDTLTVFAELEAFYGYAGNQPYMLSIMQALEEGH